MSHTRQYVSIGLMSGTSMDGIEAQAFAYLAVRALRGLPLSWPTTTGVRESTSGGVQHLPTAA